MSAWPVRKPSKAIIGIIKNLHNECGHVVSPAQERRQSIAVSRDPQKATQENITEPKPIKIDHWR